MILSSCQVPISNLTPEKLSTFDLHNQIMLDTTKSTIQALTANKSIILSNRDIGLQKINAIQGIPRQYSLNKSREITVDNATDNAMLTQVTPEVQTQLDSIVAEYIANTPKPPKIFTDTIPSGCGEDDRYIYIGGAPIDKLDPNNTDTLIELAKVYEDVKLNKISTNEIEKALIQSRGVYRTDKTPWRDANGKPLVCLAFDATAFSEADISILFDGFSQWDVNSNHVLQVKRVYPSPVEWAFWQIGLYRITRVGSTAVLDLFRIPAAAITPFYGNTGVSSVTFTNNQWASWDDPKLFTPAWRAESMKAVAAHELGHVWGLSHEHQRPDRDNSVQIVTSNINPADYDLNYSVVQDVWFLFWKIASSISVGAFDFSSIMLYDSGKEGHETIWRLQKQRLYMNTVVSPNDIATVKNMYGLAP